MSFERIRDPIFCQACSKLRRIRDPIFCQTCSKLRIIYISYSVKLVSKFLLCCSTFILKTCLHHPLTDLFIIYSIK